MPTTGTVILTGAGPAASDIVYKLDTSGTLTRKAGENQIAKLLGSVTALSVEKPSAGSLSTVTLEAKIRGYRSQQDSVVRQMQVNVGADAWRGGV